MAIEYINKAEHMLIECDICPEEDELEGTFQDCINRLKSRGWKVKKHQGEWYHFCSEKCLGKL